MAIFPNSDLRPLAGFHNTILNIGEVVPSFSLFTQSMGTLNCW